MVYLVPVIATLWNPLRFASAATSSTMCSHGRGERSAADANER